VNESVLDHLPGEAVQSLSVDTVTKVDQQSVYPVEYVNSLNLSGLPPRVGYCTLKLELQLCCYETRIHCMATATGEVTSCDSSAIDTSKLRVPPVNMQEIY